MAKLHYFLRILCAEKDNLVSKKEFNSLKALVGEQQRNTENQVLGCYMIIMNKLAIIV